MEARGVETLPRLDPTPLGTPRRPHSVTNDRAPISRVGSRSFFYTPRKGEEGLLAVRIR